MSAATESCIDLIRSGDAISSHNKKKRCIMSATIELDNYDLKLLAALQRGDRLSQSELSVQVNLSPSQCSRRIQRLRIAGFIERETTLLSARMLGLDVMAFVSVTLERQQETSSRSFNVAVQAREQILECHAVTGDADYLLRVVAKDLKSFSDFLMDELMVLPGVSNVRSTIVLDSIKSSSQLPLP